MLLQMTSFHSFLWLILLSMGIDLFNPVVCWWAFGWLPCLGYCKSCWYEHSGCRYHFELVFSFFLGINPGIKLLDHNLVLFLVFKWTSILLSISARTNLSSHQQCTRILCSSQPHQHLLFVDFLRIGILRGVDSSLWFSFIFLW